MKKSILNIGKALNRAEQKQISGGEGPGDSSGDCSQPSNLPCTVPVGGGPAYECNLNEVCIPIRPETQAGICQCP